MSDPLLIAATPELLEGWNGPVLAADGVPGVLVGPDQRPEDERRGLWVVCPVGEWPDLEGTAYSEMPMSCLTSEVFLDLRRAECRDHVARVLTATGERPCGWSDARVELNPYDDWELVWDSEGEMRTLVEDLGLSSYVAVPLCALDWQAGDTLPDGSRRVDALALAVVAREVCGG